MVAHHVLCIFHIWTGPCRDRRILVSSSLLLSHYTQAVCLSTSTLSIMFCSVLDWESNLKEMADALQ